MALKQSYYDLWFVSFRLLSTSGHRDAIHLKLKRNQNLPPEIAEECKVRSQDPFSLLTECNRDYFTNYPVSTEFLLTARLTDREGGTMFFYSSYRWQAIDVVKRIALPLFQR